MRKLRNEELDRPKLKEYKEMEKLPLTLILDNIRSAHNVGSIFRSADSFLVERIICCGFTPVPPHREIRKTALGATESVRWEYAERSVECASELKRKGVGIIVLEQTTESGDLHDWFPVPDKEYALVLGNEVEGVNPELVALADACLEIRQFGTKHSLNVSVCAGIVLWDLAGKLIQSKR